MPSSILYALLSLVFAGVNDVVFKRYAAKDRSRGAYVFGIGLIWVILQLPTALAGGVEFHFASVTLVYGLIAGLFLTASNLLLLESLTHIDASLGSTIYRLNTMGVVVLALLFLNESLGLYKGVGIAAGILAVFLLYRRDGHSHQVTQRTFLLYFTLAVVASLFRALYGVTSKAGLLNGASLQPMLILGALSWVVGGAGYAFFREGRLRMTRIKATYSLISGVLVFLIVNSLLLAIEHGQASTVIPIANMSFILALILSVALGMERFTPRKFAAVAAAVCSILLLTLA
ncbi:DMT family transporter [Geopsychrobacter electrodiphilus]|uniref:DMT family transporter n=1 Tax=Geopsychrobacter electrodiphilus TaxID=225196 RepID=UPI0003749709|nr:DMT family transporter [Geopsychrobacter electrodiphilus]